MKKLTDEDIMSYVDGALDERDRLSIERRLEGDDDARRLVAQMRESAALLRDAFEPTLREAVPQRLIDTVLAGGKMADNVVPFGASARRQRRWSGLGIAGAAIAATVVLTVGAIGLVDPGRFGIGGSSGATIALGRLPVNSPVAKALETLPSGRAVAIDIAKADGKLMILSTFRDERSQPCREFELSARAVLDADEVAIACRLPEGAWTVVGAATLTKPAAMDGNDFTPASDLSVDPLGKVFEAIGAGPQLAADEEQAQLEGGWK